MVMDLILISLAVLLLGSVVCALTDDSKDGMASRIGVVTGVAGTVPAIIAAVTVLITGLDASIRLAWQMPFGSFYLSVDPLSAFFIMTISIICSLAALYGKDYLAVYKGRKNIGLHWSFYNLLFASMLLVVVSRNALLFLIAWEIMSLSSFFLVMFEHERYEVRLAGWIYLVAAHAGQACLMFLFIYLGADNATLDFDRFSIPSGATAAGTIFLLALAGFGAKAGFLPFHVWLPDAHPAAPSHVSAVMSGVMIKTGIYGLIRIVSLFETPPQWWGWALVLVGAVTGVTGVLFALAQHDIKRLLAYSSIENIGIIGLGLGLWLLGVSTNNSVLASLGLMGGLLHVLNHAVFKSLLFLGAGAVAHAAGTRNIDSLGGLLKRMPVTALTFGIGSAAICGLPPLNGFVSEFLIYLSAFGFAAHTGTQTGPVTCGLIVLAALGLIGGLAMACFVKVFGIVFLGAARTGQAAGAHEAPWTMRFAMTVLAILCVVIGLVGPLAVRMVNPVVAQLLGTEQISAASVIASGILWKIGWGGFVLILMTGFLWFLRSWLLKRRVNLVGPTWDCGYAFPNSRMQYTSSSFTWPLIGMFSRIVRPALHVKIDKGFFPQRARLSSHSDDPLRQGLFDPIFRTVSEMARRAHVLQQGRNQLYVLYIAVTVLLLLLFKVR